MSTSTPGRVYAECSDFSQVIKLARSFAELNLCQVTLVPREDVPRILNSSPSRMNWPWATVRDVRIKWKWYAGDTGLITRIEGQSKKYLALIPRINKSASVQNGQSRPPQALAVRRNLDIDRVCQAELYGRYIWRGHLFSPEGFLLVDLDNITTVTFESSKPLPSPAELTLFRTTSFLSTAEAERTAQQVAQAHLNIGDKVKVISGPYLHLIGVVRGMKENEASVYLPSQNITEDMLIDTVRAAFTIGDYVKVLNSQNHGLVGWVVGISEATLRVLNMESETEVNVL